MQNQVPRLTEPKDAAGFDKVSSENRMAPELLGSSSSSVSPYQYRPVSSCEKSEATTVQGTHESNLNCSSLAVSLSTHSQIEKMNGRR